QYAGNRGMKSAGKRPDITALLNVSGEYRLMEQTDGFRFVEICPFFPQAGDLRIERFSEIKLQDIGIVSNFNVTAIQVSGWDKKDAAQYIQRWTMNIMQFPESLACDIDGPS